LEQHSSYASQNFFNHDPSNAQFSSESKSNFSFAKVDQFNNTALKKQNTNVLVTTMAKDLMSKIDTIKKKRDFMNSNKM